MKIFEGNKYEYFKYDFSKRITYSELLNKTHFPFYDKIRKIFTIMNNVQNNSRYVCVVKDENSPVEYSDIVYDYYENSIYYDGIIYERYEFERYINRLTKLQPFK